jgi:hypothetical protein
MPKGAQPRVSAPKGEIYGGRRLITPVHLSFLPPSVIPSPEGPPRLPQARIAAGILYKVPHDLVMEKLENKEIELTHITAE